MHEKLCASMRAVVILSVLIAFLPFCVSAREFGIANSLDEIQKYNADVKKQSPDLYKEKLKKMSENPFSFLRGSAHLMHRDIATTPQLNSLLSGAPKGLVCGDLHLHNFGVLYFEGKSGSYSPEDLDEAYFGAPLSYDLFRLSVSFDVAFHEILKESEVEAAIDSLIDGYLNGLFQQANPDWPNCAMPKVLRKFIEKSLAISREDFLKKLTCQTSPNKFRYDKKLSPVDKEIRKPLQEALEKYLIQIARSRNLPADFVTILDLGSRSDKGLSSIGLRRYFALLQGDSKNWKSSRILEIKQIRPSSVGPATLATQARDTLKGFELSHRDRDVFLGVLSLGDHKFLVRELFPWSGRLEYSDLKKEEVSHFAKALGAVLADFHSGSHKNQEMVAWVKANRAALIDWVRRYGNQVRDDWRALKQLIND